MRSAGLEWRGEKLDAYLHRLLMSVSGWAGYARYRGWEKELQGLKNGTVAELLSIRLAWELVLLESLAATGLPEAWGAECDAAAVSDDQAAAEADLSIDLVLQAAYEKAWQRELTDQLTPKQPSTPAVRKSVQAAFCIDVRSEIFRRAFESIDPGIETIGFAGFFGFPMEYVPLGQTRGGAQCPVLLTPKFVIRETIEGTTHEELTQAVDLRRERKQFSKAWKSFKSAAVSSFSFVETVGLSYTAKLVTDSFGLSRTISHPTGAGLGSDVRKRLRPGLDSTIVRGRLTGLATDDGVATAEAVLKAMSPTEGLARIVILTGHGSSTTNNPYATTLDCGACGGHTGEANARLAAAVLNDHEVRSVLAARGIVVPEDTIFLGCLHDTTARHHHDL